MYGHVGDVQGIEEATCLVHTKPSGEQGIDTYTMTQQYLYLHRVLFAYFFEKHKKTFDKLLVGEMKDKYEKWISNYKMATKEVKPT